ncbi:hypothetical protein DRP07_01675 [Archaeoglobales archaeon]|nr:MAG: hypothetical protein DRP07_01675 [Archaeoglobales archaeon]
MLIVCDNCGGDEFRINEKMIAVCILCGNKIKLCDGDRLKLKEEEEKKGEFEEEKKDEFEANTEDTHSEEE